MSSEINALGSVENAGESDAKSILDKYLTEGEMLRWTGRPLLRWGRDLRRCIPVIGFFLIIFFFTVLSFLSQNARRGENEATKAVPAQQEQAPSREQGPTPLIGVIVVSVLVAAFSTFWCYMMFRGLGGQKLIILSRLSHTYYGLTDHRIIVVTGKNEFKILSYHLRSVEGLRLREDSDGVGTINLGPRDRSTNPFQPEDSPPLTLKNIPRAAYVFGLIFKAQDRLLEKSP